MNPDAEVGTALRSLRFFAATVAALVAGMGVYFLLGRALVSARGAWFGRTFVTLCCPLLAGLVTGALQAALADRRRLPTAWIAATGIGFAVGMNLPLLLAEKLGVAALFALGWGLVLGLCQAAVLPVRGFGERLAWALAVTLGLGADGPISAWGVQMRQQVIASGHAEQLALWSYLPWLATIAVTAATMTAAWAWLGPRRIEPRRDLRWELAMAGLLAVLATFLAVAHQERRRWEEERSDLGAPVSTLASVVAVAPRDCGPANIAPRPG